MSVSCRMERSCSSHITVEKTVTTVKQLWTGKTRDFAESSTSHQHTGHPKVSCAGKLCSAALLIPCYRGTEGAAGCLDLVLHRKALFHKQSGCDIKRGAPFLRNHDSIKDLKCTGSVELTKKNYRYRLQLGFLLGVKMFLI